MFTAIIKNLLKPEKNESHIIDQDGMFHIAAVFIRIARLDGHFDENEMQEIKTLLKKRYKISGNNIEEIISTASKLEQNLNDNFQLTRKIKETVDFQERFNLLQDAWKIIKADGERNYKEDSFMRLFCNLLGLSDKDNAIARKNSSE